MRNAMLADFLGGSTLVQLSKKYDIGIPRMRGILVKRLGKRKYLQTCRANGGRAVAKKLKNAQYRTKYAANMSISVKRKLSILMQREGFRQAWIEKAGAGSKRGTEALSGLMKDGEF